MTSHELAKSLLSLPNLPVIFFDYEYHVGREIVRAVEEQERYRRPGEDKSSVKNDALGYPIPRPCIHLKSYNE